MTMVASTAEGSKRRVAAPILVVDDEPDILDVVVMMLEVEGYETETARDGTEALTAIERERPSLVLLDMRMPRMDGWEFARTLAERGLDIPVVVMTAARDARRWADEIDADAYLGKPFQMDALIRTIRRVLERDG
jgi:CheY-like chemotaxis protein